MRIKICGLSRMEDIEYANLAMPDYIGFVFAESRRRVSDETAMKLKSALSPRIKAVGVFVNDKAERSAALCRAGVIDLVQLHGDEDGEYIRRLKKTLQIPVIKAIPIDDKFKDGKFNDTLPDADYILLDSFDKQKRGGSGKRFDWALISESAGQTGKPFFLAGGLNEDNFAAAAQLEPFCLDVSSGAETDGVKDKKKMLNLVRIAREL
jgi:phosphoribosylanthranilate isomerase